MQTEHSNIVACVALADTVGSDGDLAVTNDGATILKHILIEHPAAQILATAALAQDEAYGDGTTSVVLLAAAMLSASDALLKFGFHPSEIVRGFTLAHSVARVTFDRLARHVAADRTDDYLLAVAHTCIGSKVIGRFSQHFARMAVDAARLLQGSTCSVRQRLHVVVAPGGSLLDSALVRDGVLLDRAACATGPQCVRRARVLVTRLEPSSSTDTALVRRMCDQILVLGVSVLINQGLLYPEAEQYLGARGVLCVSNAGYDAVRLAARVLHCAVVADLHLVDAHSLGAADAVESVQIGDRSYVRVSGCPSPVSACSVLVRGPTVAAADECARALHDAFCVVTAAEHSRSVLPGGGVVQTHAATAVRQHASTLQASRQSVIMNAYADALLVIPQTLEQQQPQHSKQQPRQSQQQRQQPLEPAVQRIDSLAASDVTVAAVPVNAVMEVACVAQSILRTATLTAAKILQIDRVVMHKPIAWPQ